MHSANSHNRDLVDLTASSPAPEAAAAMPSSPLPEWIGAAETPPSSPRRAPRRVPAPAPVKLRWDPAADLPRKQRAGPTIPAKAAEGTPKLTAFFAPVASGSGSKAGGSKVAGSEIEGNLVGKKRIARRRPWKLLPRRKAEWRKMQSELAVSLQLA